jgi:hypothetical protein
MAFPVAPVRQPSALAGKTNGKLPSSILIGIPSLHGGKDTTLLRATSARAFRAMRAAAEKGGLRMETVSSYRSYAQQEAIFRERYVPHFARHTDGSVRFKVWNGVRWYHAFGATAAVPGTSNHGLALADDFITSTRWQTWMVANAGLFGWSWEIQSEPWHLRYVTGDQIPRAVLAYEAGLKPPAPPAPAVNRGRRLVIISTEGA